MKGGPVVVWSALLAAGLLSAYLTWTRDAGTGLESSVRILDLDPAEITALRLETANQTLEVSRAEGEWWVSVTKRPSAPGAESASDAEESEGDQPGSPLESGTAQKPPGPTRVQFHANEGADGLVAGFAPLAALRDLGSLSPQRLAEFGLDSPGKTLTVVYEGGEESFDVGGHPYGSPNIYLRRRADGRVYLVRADPLSELEDSEASLLDRRLHRFALPDIDRVVVSAGGRHRELARRHGDDAASFWADAATPQERNDLFESWLQRAHQLYVSEVLPRGAPEAASTPVVTIGYYRGDTKQGRLELRSEPAGEGVAKRFRARSEHTLRWVRVAPDQADAVARDVGNVLSP